ncbi:hypothetical protein HCU64_14700 [Methylobacterium sp. C25]|uniref:DUF6894 family protein n=1 Tax=Methylobacterium sp. C25 TaxID=2721622 RepID=UPI001F45E15C|nr:hypothetical protein [Methylobacterium sp. C25]MCE4225008.1 hypothetical protein [Methylobacterium sp. C25]
MPRFFIDVDADHRMTRDEDGADFLNLEAAQKEALAAMEEILRVRLSDGSPHAATSSIRDEAGELVFMANLSLTINED